jgi:hypothetical protein
LKQARHRASRRFLKDGARSLLPQYLHTSLSALVADRDFLARAFLAFEVGAVFASTAVGFESVFT